MMNKFNFLEAYYKIYRAYGKTEADNLLNTMKQMPITIHDTLTIEKTIKVFHAMKYKGDCRFRLSGE